MNTNTNLGNYEIQNLHTWIKTDDDQFVYRFSESEFKVIEIILWGDEGEYAVDIQYIDVDEYEYEELLHTVVGTFGYDESDLDWLDNQLVAEMLAEDTADKQVCFWGDWDECYQFIQEYIHEHENGLN